MINLMLFVSLVLHLCVVAGAFAVHNARKGLSKVEYIVLGCVTFSAVAALLGLFK